MAFKFYKIDPWTSLHNWNAKSLTPLPFGAFLIKWTNFSLHESCNNKLSFFKLSKWTKIWTTGWSDCQSKEGGVPWCYVGKFHFFNTHLSYLLNDIVKIQLTPFCEGEGVGWGVPMPCRGIVGVFTGFWQFNNVSYNPLIVFYVDR